MRRSEQRKHGEMTTASFWWERSATLLRNYFVARMSGATMIAESVEPRLVDAAQRWGRTVGSEMGKGAENTMRAYLEACRAMCDAVAEDDADAVDGGAHLIEKATGMLAEFMRALKPGFPEDTLRTRLRAHTKLLLSAMGHYVDGNNAAYEVDETERLGIARQVGLLLDEWGG